MVETSIRNRRPLTSKATSDLPPSAILAEHPALADLEGELRFDERIVLPGDPMRVVAHVEPKPDLGGPYRGARSRAAIGRVQHFAVDPERGRVYLKQL